MRQKTAHIICDRYLNPDGTNITIGGMQSYFSALSEVLKEEGYNVHIYHAANTNFKTEYNGITIFGHEYNGSQDKLPKVLFEDVIQNADKSQDLIIFGSEMWIVDNKGFRCLAIQHGIPWDIPVRQNCSNLVYWLYYLKKAFKAYRNIRNVNKVSDLVCVDYNYINWYRALVAYPKTNLHCIPNFSKLPTCSYYKSDDIIRIIFARRLWQYRGTRIFGNVIYRLLTEYSNIYITIAGDGPEEKWLKTKLSKFKNVEFIQYSSNESIKIHQNKQIAIVPTIGSEGTSLSLLEAMAAKCAVICTDVGGLTNIILNGFNGIIVPANNEEALYYSLKSLINNQARSEELANNGYMSVMKSFSFDIWKQSWKEIIRGRKI